MKKTSLVTPHKHRHKHIRLMVIAFGVVGVLLVVVSRATNLPARSVLGVATSAYRSGVVSWSPVSGAWGYNVYYKDAADKNYIHAVRGLSASSTTYTIGYLKRTAKYQYKVAAYDKTGKEFWTSDPQWIWNYQ